MVRLLPPIPSLLSTQSMTDCFLPEMSIATDLNDKLVPPHAKEELKAGGLDIDNFQPLTRDEMMAKLD